MTSPSAMYNSNTAPLSSFQYSFHIQTGITNVPEVLCGERRQPCKKCSKYSCTIA